MRRLAAVLGLAFLLCGAATNATASDCTTYPSANCTAAQFLETIRKELGSSLAEAVAVQQQLSFALQDNQLEQEALRGLITESEVRLAALDAELVRLQGEIDATVKRIELKRAELTALARTVSTEPTSFLLLAARARDLGEIFTRTSDLIAAGVRGRALKAGLEADLQALKTDLDKQQLARDQEEAVRQDLMASRQRLGQLAGQGESIGGQLAAAITRVQNELAALSGQSPALAASIKADLLDATTAAVAAAQGAVWAQAIVWQQLNLPAPPGHQVSTGGSAFRLAWPVDHPHISQGYGPSDLLIEPPYGGYPHFHTGVDLADVIGTPIMAARAGVVSLVGSTAVGYGNFVIVAHENGYATLYGHLLRSFVRAGDVVGQGERIGLMGSTGWSTGPHVHFELRLDGQPRDPSPFLPPLPGLGT